MQIQNFPDKSASAALRFDYLKVSLTRKGYGSKGKEVLYFNGPVVLKSQTSETLEASSHLDFLDYTLTFWTAQGKPVTPGSTTSIQIEGADKSSELSKVSMVVFTNSM
jgi:hypothetical protein